MKLYKHKRNFQFVLLRNGFLGNLTSIGWTKWCPEQCINWTQWYQEYKEIELSDLPDHLQIKYKELK